MNTQTINMLKSWAGTFMVAVITALTTILTTTGELPLDGNAWKGIAVAGLVAVLPVIRNYLDRTYAGYGRN